MINEPRQQKTHTIKDSKMPEHSTMYDRVIPAVLIVLGIIMVGLILFSLGLLTGLLNLS